jgi:hypothetical protein
MQTTAPSWANRFATALPIPREAPLMTATLFASFTLIYFQSVMKIFISLR